MFVGKTGNGYGYQPTQSMNTPKAQQTDPQNWVTTATKTWEKKELPTLPQKKAPPLATPISGMGSHPANGTGNRILSPVSPKPLTSEVTQPSVTANPESPPSIKTSAYGNSPFPLKGKPLPQVPKPVTESEPYAYAALAAQQNPPVKSWEDAWKIPVYNPSLSNSATPSPTKPTQTWSKKETPPQPSKTTPTSATNPDNTPTIQPKSLTKSTAVDKLFSFGKKGYNVIGSTIGESAGKFSEKAYNWADKIDPEHAKPRPGQGGSASGTSIPNSSFIPPKVQTSFPVVQIMPKDVRPAGYEHVSDIEFAKIAGPFTVKQARDDVLPNPHQGLDLTDTNAVFKRYDYFVSLGNLANASNLLNRAIDTAGDRQDKRLGLVYIVRRAEVELLYKSWDGYNNAAHWYAIAARQFEPGTLERTKFENLANSMIPLRDSYL